MISPWVWYVIIAYMLIQAAACIVATRLRSIVASVIVVVVPMLLAGMLTLAAAVLLSAAISRDADRTFDEIAASLPSSSPAIVPASDPPSSVWAPKLTVDSYERLQPGMCPTGVYLVLNDFGTEVSSAGSLETRIYRDGGRRIVVTFEKGQLVAKAQSGL